MASLPPGPCCAKFEPHDGTPVGKHQTVYGNDTYVSGAENSAKKTIVILTDIFGNRFINSLLIADKLAEVGYRVYIPDICKGDPVPPNETNFGPWLKEHPNEVTRPIVVDFLKNLRKEIGNDAYVGVIGYCYGAKYAIQQIAPDGYADVCAIAHPSFVTIEEVDAIKKPLLISAAETDAIFPNELRHQSEDVLAKNKSRYQIDLFSGVVHGYTIKGDSKDPVTLYAQRKTLDDQIRWFATFQ